MKHCLCPVSRAAFAIALALLTLARPAASAQLAASNGFAVPPSRPACLVWSLPTLHRNPTPAEIRCRYDIAGPGRFGLSVYMDVPVYQPATPLPGTHVVGVPGMPRPWPGESYEEWEWRVLRSEYGPEARHALRALELLDPLFASRLMEFESRLNAAGIRFTRRETWRSPQRQAYLFQQGRSRPGPLVTTTLTSWHSMVDERGTPSARAADYNVARGHMTAFHEIAASAGLESYGAESNDPGHVYMHHAEPISSEELVFLRLLPRVPYVTLATGRPVDESVARHERAEFRLASALFASEPFFPYPSLNLAGFPSPSVARSEEVPPPAIPGLQIERPAEVGALTLLVRWLGRRGR